MIIIIIIIISQLFYDWLNRVPTKTSKQQQQVNEHCRRRRRRRSSVWCLKYIYWSLCVTHTSRINRLRPKKQSKKNFWPNIGFITLIGFVFSFLFCLTKLIIISHFFSYLENKTKELSMSPPRNYQFVWFENNNQQQQQLILIIQIFWSFPAKKKHFTYTKR